MQDIRKPYTRSRSSEDLSARLERFHDGRNRDTRGYEDEEPVRIPVRGGRMQGSITRRTDYEDDVDWQDEEPYRPRIKDVQPRVRVRRQKPSISSILFGAGLAVFIGGIVLYTYAFDSATITVVPKYKDVQDFSRVITFTKEGDTTSSVPYLIETIAISKSKVLNRSESRKVETKAFGDIVIYNDFDEKPQKLIKNTRFESSTGKIYRINESVVVPGKNGNTPGTIVASVYADSTGSDYNITSTNFTIPGFKGTPRYETFYAKSKTALTGGSSGAKSLVSLADINSAKDALAIELEKEVKQKLAEIQKEGYVPMIDAIQVVFEDNEAELLNGEGEMYKVTATGYVMLAQSSKLAELIAASIVGYDKSPVRLGYTDTLSFARRDTTSIVNATSLPILVEGDPRIIWLVDGESIKKMVLGKETDEFKMLMKSILSIESAEIRFSPMWLSHFPNNIEKIVVEESLPKR